MNDQTSENDEQPRADREPIEPPSPGPAEAASCAEVTFDEVVGALDGTWAGHGTLCD
jgi:hypothetical protein